MRVEADFQEDIDTLLRLDLSHEYRRPPRDELAGGDVVAFVPHEDFCTTLLVADLSAKSVAGTRSAKILANAFHLACETFSLPSQILKQLNNVLIALFSDAAKGLFATAFVCRFSESESCCTYSSAGAEPPILWKDTRFYQTLPSSQGIVLGVETDAVYNDFVMPIAANDTLIAFTDGISESVRIDGGERLGVHGIIEAMISALKGTTRPHISQLLSEIDRLNGSAYHDDASLVLASMHPRPNYCDDLNTRHVAAFLQERAVS